MKTILSLLIALFFTFNTTGVKAQDSIVKAVHDSPSVFFGETKVGGVCSRDSKTISIRNNEGSLMPDYKIVSFKLTINKVSEVYHAYGTVLSGKMQSVLSTLKQGDELFFLVKVISPDGIARLISCSYFIE